MSRPVEMQEIEGVIDEPHAALAVCRRLGMGEARQSGVVDAAEFAVDIGGLHVHAGERGREAPKLAIVNVAWMVPRERQLGVW